MPRLPENAEPDVSGARELLPHGVTVLERGWLSSNCVVLLGSSGGAVVDTGYATHAQQTLQLVRSALSGLPLQIIVNTHLHSDHCGGNAILQEAYPDARTAIPPGLAPSVAHWDPVALTHVPTGQICPRFDFQHLLEPGSIAELGNLRWEVHAAPGHDPNSVILFEPTSRILLSADALWEHGFGVVFQELEGDAAFDEVADTLDLIETLRPQVVVPGHGRVFTGAPAAIARARERLDGYRADPRRHATHAAKVLLKFKLLELQSALYEDFAAWALATPYFRLVRDRWFPQSDLHAWLEELCRGLVRSGAASWEHGVICNR